MADITNGDGSGTPGEAGVDDTEDSALAEAVTVVEAGNGTAEVEVEMYDFLDDSGEGGAVLEGDTAVAVEETGDRVTYDASPWATETRTMLTSLLQAEGIAHAWQGTEVTVHEKDEDAVDRLVAEVLAAAAPALDADAPKVVYGVAGWSAALQTELVDGLVEAAIPFEWNHEGDLVVLADDEERVEELLESLPDDEDGDESADDGMVVHEVLDRLFVASDRLQRKPSDARATVDAVESAKTLGRMSLPFGFDESAWRRLVEQAGVLASELDGGAEEPLDDDGVAALAGEVRTLVAQYV